MNLSLASRVHAIVVVPVSVAKTYHRKLFTKEISLPVNLYVESIEIVD